MPMKPLTLFRVGRQEQIKVYATQDLRYASHKQTEARHALLSMRGVDIGMFQELRILGLTLDDKLTFNTLVGNICRKA